MGSSTVSEPNGPEDRGNGPTQQRFPSKKLCLLLATVLAILTPFLFYVLGRYHVPDFSELLKRAQLAALPTSITNLQVEIRPAVDGDRAVPNECWLFVRFEAEPYAIDRFVKESAGIDRSRSRSLSTATNSSENPSWWFIDQSAPGRIHHFRNQEDVHTGDVIVDERANTVLLFIWFKADPRIRRARDSFEKLRDEVEDSAENLFHRMQGASGK